MHLSAACHQSLTLLQHLQLLFQFLDGIWAGIKFSKIIAIIVLHAMKHILYIVNYSPIIVMRVEYR